MTMIAPKLQAQHEAFSETVPDPITKPILGAREELLTTWDPSKVIKVGEELPSFTLPNAVGTKVSSSHLLTQGPIVIIFYRGEWCPFCNIALAGLQAHISDFKAKGVTLVAISPELPNDNLNITEKHRLDFAVLTDLRNEYAKKLGIVFKQSERVRPAFQKLGIDVPKRNGDDSFELPIPATLLVDRSGVIRNVYADPDYVKRVEPKTVLGWVDEL